jgi:peptide-methionine (S)-S-oxide reductase
MAFITLGGGCFWCTQPIFDQIRGVIATQVGYCNGHVLHPTYEQVCAGDTGHNEVVRIEYDPQQVHLHQLLEVFFAIHDPTTLNRQGNDVGEQYRSGIYPDNEADLQTAVQVRSEANLAHQGRVVTEIQLLSSYSPAEAYHHQYFVKNPTQGYCASVISPKIQKFHQTFKHLKTP